MLLKLYQGGSIMLSKITIKNYYSIKDEVTLKVNKDITSIIGKNESLQ